MEGKKWADLACTLQALFGSLVRKSLGSMPRVLAEQSVFIFYPQFFTRLCLIFRRRVKDGG
jgi:hypothetical protein